MRAKLIPGRAALPLATTIAATLLAGIIDQRLRGPGSQNHRARLIALCRDDHHGRADHSRWHPALVTCSQARATGHQADTNVITALSCAAPGQ